MEAHSLHTAAVDARSCRRSPVIAPGGSVIRRLSEPRTAARGVGFDDDCGSGVPPIGLPPHPAPYLLPSSSAAASAFPHGASPGPLALGTTPAPSPSTSPPVDAPCCRLWTPSSMAAAAPAPAAGRARRLLPLRPGSTGALAKGRAGGSCRAQLGAEEVEVACC